MKLIYLIILTTCIIGFVQCEKEKDKKTGGQLQIGIKKRIADCKLKSKKGDLLHMHYSGYLDDGSVFDTSENKNPFTFKLGAGQVIKGWDRGLLGMCVDEVRKLVIPPELAYGERGAPPKIPPNAVLTFEVTLIKIEQREDL